MNRYIPMPEILQDGGDSSNMSFGKAKCALGRALLRNDPDLAFDLGLEKNDDGISADAISFVTCPGKNIAGKDLSEVTVDHEINFELRTKIFCTLSNVTNKKEFGHFNELVIRDFTIEPEATMEALQGLPSVPRKLIGKAVCAILRDHWTHVLETNQRFDMEESVNDAINTFEERLLPHLAKAG